MISFIKFPKFYYILNMQNIQFEYDPKWQGVNFLKPQKKIILFEDVNSFTDSKIYNEYINFLAKLQESIVSKAISVTKPIPKFKIFQPFFNRLEQLLKQVPPINQPMRYGNKAFKDWALKSTEQADRFLKQIIPQKIKGCHDELKCYISESFGSNVRMDYGTGHEMSFMFFCWALYRLGFCNEQELENLVRQVFYRYVGLMRKVQVQYMLEPAGSHGVWGLDDYHFLPFLLGAAELIKHDVLGSPLCIHNAQFVSKYADEYMYLNCVRFIMEQKKTASFSQTSPILDNISGAASWQKVTGGMVKMYKAQVLGKHPVIKHQYFGTIIPFEIVKK